MKSAVFSHAVKVYKALEDAATEQEIEGATYLVYQGHTLDLYRNLDIPMAYYSVIFKTLYSKDYVTQVKRGNRATASVLVLNRSPRREDFVKTGEKDLTDAEDFATLVADVENIKNRLGGLNIVEALANYEQRITVLEGKLKSQ
jgi:hypothetical protein